MKYLDSSVLLAELFAEQRRPPAELWDESLVSSRLIVYEVWSNLHVRGLGDSLRETVESLFRGLELLDMEEPVLARALDPFPTPIRALDAMHLASADFLRGQGLDVSVASYDGRMREAAHGMGFELYPLN